MDPEHALSDSEVENSKTPNREAAVASGPGWAYAILRALTGDRIPDGTLGADTVPAQVLSVPVALAIENLVRHAKKCQRPQCAHVPPTLVRYKHMRPEAIRAAQEPIHKVLWNLPQHELVVWVRKEILKEHSSLAEELSAGRLLESDHLTKRLNELGPDSASILAAVLWASEFKGPQSEALFKALIPIAQKSAPREKPKEAPANERELKTLREKLKTQRKELEETARAAKDATRALEPKERELRKKSRELADAHDQLDAMTRELGKLQGKLQDVDLVTASLEKTSKVNAELRRDLRVLQVAQRGVQEDRSELTRQLGVERRNIEHLKRQVSNTPSGTDAMREILRSEEQRIKNDRIILAGGARLRADNEWTAYRKLEKAFFESYPQYLQPRPVTIHAKSRLRFVALGGSGEIGRSCYLLELGENRILVDCGIKPSSSEDIHPTIARIEKLDALILTHAHTDHIGWVPALLRRFPELDVYCSEGTAGLLPVVLEDCRQHYVRKMTGARTRAKYSHNPEPIVDAYDEEDMRAVQKHLITCNFDEEERLPRSDISIQFFHAGHILGAASVLIKDQSGRRVFFSGDFASFPQLTVRAARWPEDLGEIDLLVLESTYGNSQHNPLEESRSDLVAFIQQTVERRGSVILASFAMGRAQELLTVIAAARKSGQIASSIPVYVDGMIKLINPIYRKHATFDVQPEEYYEVIGEAERNEAVFQAQSKPAIILTTSGMLTGGPVIEYAQKLLPNARNRIVLTGYQDEGAPSRALRELVGPGSKSSRMVQITDEYGGSIEFEAAMPAELVKLSAHADRPGLLGYAGRMRPKHIALVHGYPEVQSELAFGLAANHRTAEITCGPSELDIP